ncbi:MAG: replicative DNA helicase [Blastocatellia bacterium]|nr:replicative DNA helicase [Blastocatellia bacterium]MCS7156475.1 replicative DNA helicase [Blastocatellia bacterium]MCX7751784.1 replicative DNA helicase [Blastocatellia bacterium]MDW8168886.1 replicative DNA helicase [Acidobacteriota bacterium]MDW8256646.1 replicative DNA helicase [Acidobacteriota bacterium]
MSGVYEDSAVTLPHAVETERSILGLILLDNTALHHVLAHLNREDFYVDAHRRIFEKMIALYEKGRPVDPITLKEELAASGELEQVGGAVAIARLMDGLPQLQNIEHYVRIVREKSLLRKLIRAAQQIITECLGAPEDPEEVIDRAQAAILRIAEERATRGFVGIGEIARAQLLHVEQMAGRPQMITGLPTGFTDLDQMTSGLQSGDMIIVAGRPSSGKTSFALSIAQNVAEKGYTVGIASLEMSKEQLVQRMLCSAARINLHRFRGGFLSREEWGRLAEALGRLAACKIFIDDTPAMTPLELRAKARRLKHEKGLDLLIVDYLQMMATRGRFENRQQEVSAISRELKQIAKDLNVPLIAVSQLSRAPEARTSHRPQLSDLRDSGSLEQDADVVLFVYREEMYNPGEENEGIAEIIIGKQRNGPTGSVQVAFVKEFTRFENLWQE